MSSSKLLMQAFERMLRRFGSRKWWPGDTPFEVMVGAILTQNTSWKNVEKAITNIKRERALSPRKLYEMGPARLSTLIKPAGYFRVKTKRLRNFLKFFIEIYDGRAEEMAKEETSAMREKLLSVSGIGPETADSMLLYALERPVFVVDAYTKRILIRHSLCSEEADYHEVQEFFTDRLPLDAALFNEYHALIVETGKDFCRSKPRCDSCPLKGWNLDK